MDVKVKEKLQEPWVSDTLIIEIADLPAELALRMEFLNAIPIAQENYSMRRTLMRDLLAYLPQEDPILLYGPTGAGKSTGILQLAARLGIPVFRMTGSDNTEIADFFGMYSLVDGSTKFVYGPVVKAAQLGGIFLLDEADRVREDVLIGLNGIAEGLKSFVIPMTGEIIKPIKGFKVVFTGNSNLGGSSIYLTARQHDPSVPERFVATKVDYPESEEEHAILMEELDKTGFNKDQIAYLMEQEGCKLNIEGVTKEGALITGNDWVSGLLQVAAMIRAQSRDGGNESSSALERTISVRSLGRWLRYTVQFCGASAKGQSALHYALRRSLTNTCSESTALAIHTILTTVFGVKEVLEG
jgi:cobaltochelatase CobS